MTSKFAVAKVHGGVGYTFLNDVDKSKRKIMKNQVEFEYYQIASLNGGVSVIQVFIKHTITFSVGVGHLRRYTLGT